MRILKDGIDISGTGNFTVCMTDEEVREALSVYKKVNDLKYILCGSPFYNEIFNEIDRLDELKKNVKTLRKNNEELIKNNTALIDYIKQRNSIPDSIWVKENVSNDFIINKGE